MPTTTFCSEDCECPTCREKIYAIFNEAYDNTPEIREICLELGLGKKKPTQQKPTMPTTAEKPQTSVHLTPEQRTEINKLGEAMFCEAYPCNPRPFARGLLTYLTNGGDITYIPARKILHTLVGTTFHQMFSFSLKEILEKTQLEPKEPIRVLQEMEELSEKPGFQPEDWEPFLPYLILPVCQNLGVYDSLEEYKALHPTA